MKTSIRFTGGRSFTTDIRGHTVTADIPKKRGGSDTGPTPVELFISSLGFCVGMFAVRYLETAKLSPKGLLVEMNREYDETKTRIGRISVSITAPCAKLGARKKALQAAAGKCIVHNTLRLSPDIEISVEGE